MKKNTKKTTILDQKMKVAANPGEAWYNGTQYFLAAEAEAYKSLGKEQLANFLHAASTLQKDDGYLYLYEDPTMPVDARVDVIYKPSYAVAAIAIYAFQKYSEIFDEKLNCFFRDLLEGVFRYGIIGHGIESEETVRRTLLMLCKAGLRTFLTRCHKEHLSFARAIHQHMTHFEELSEQIDTEHIVVTVNGFSPDSINHLIKELVAYWNGFTHPVFVYGTLMKGEHASWMLNNCEYAGRFLLKNYAMYNLGSYPGIKPRSGESVIGELYYASDEIVARLDEYENEGSLYKRMMVDITAGKSKISAWAYIYNLDVAGCEMMREAWNSSDDDFVWYAGYGSNLSESRFACYISGGLCDENGKIYKGASDPTPPRVTKRGVYPGSLYFGNNSLSWNGGGVAFYDPTPKGGDNVVYMKLYLITRSQLYDVMEQEGAKAHWYGRLVCLETDERGIPVYTLTSESRRPEKTPDPAYVNLIAEVLRHDFGLDERQINNYFFGGK